jgi:UDP-N-acetylglucosamine/UDP-N-acetylgalactosamine diphosphorylase
MLTGRPLLDDVRGSTYDDPVAVAAATEVLISRGVEIPHPGSVFIADDVDPERIEAGAVIHPGCRLEGARSLVLSGARLGTEGPVLVRDCGVGRGAVLASGAFVGAVLLDAVCFGHQAHVRAGTLFEEGACAANFTDTKQAILLPFAVLGSNVNFCDALLAGGRDARDHSEVGSGFIHFNFTPHGPRGDKATASLFGDVVGGAWLRRRRVFLGGAGGVVGPIRVEYGSVLGAGHVYRLDKGPDLLAVGERSVPHERAFDPVRIPRGVDRVRRNLAFMAEVAALHRLYHVARPRVAAGDPLLRALYELGAGLVAGILTERVRQLERLVDGFPASAAALSEGSERDRAEAAGQRDLAQRLPFAREALGDPSRAALREDAAARDRVLAALGGGGDWIAAVRGLSEQDAAAGTTWLASIRDAWLADSRGAAALLPGARCD